jgi:hypothetical protein
MGQERLMESLLYHDYRQQPITSDAAQDQYRQYLARLEALIADQEDVVSQARASSASDALANAHTSLWRLLTKRQGVLDALAAYEQRHAAVQQSHS